MRESILSHELRAKIEAFLVSSEDAGIKLDIFLQTGKLLYSTTEVMMMTGWSRAHITRLCRKKKLAHIPGNPNMFLLAPLIKSLEGMLIGRITEDGIVRKTRKGLKC